MRKLTQRKLTRRCFLAATLGAAVAGARTTSRGSPRPPPSAPASPTARPAAGYRFLAPAEARFVEAACDCLIPADCVGAGALEAGVPQYVDAQLAGEWGGGRRPYRSGPWQPGSPARPGTALWGTPADNFRAGLRSILEDLGRRQLDFAAAPRASRARYLRRLECGAVALDGGCPAAFFDTLLTMTVEGFFSHPRLGATRDRLPWRMRGFPGACTRLV